MKKYLMILVCWFVGCWQAMQAQVRFEADALYTVSPASQTGQVIGFSEGLAMALLVSRQASDRMQQWRISHLSGSYRLVNPLCRKVLAYPY